MISKSTLYNVKNFGILFLCAATVYFIIWSFTGRSIFEPNTYNSFSIQADAWLKGRLDIKEDHPYLELAIYKGKYYVSFPPLPSVVILPFVLFFGVNTPDHIINLVFVSISCFFAFKTAKNFSFSDESSVISALFYVLGSNVLFLMYRGWVWFLAQNISIAFCTISIYFSTTYKSRDSWLAFFFLALAIGSRPFQVIYFVITIYMAYLRYRSFKSDLKKIVFLRSFILKLMFWSIPTIAVCCLYLFYNYVRFDNIFEFGHNYLPEFLESTDGQFNIKYLSGNLGRLVQFPNITRNGLDYPKFDGFSIFMVFPMVTMTLPLSAYRLVRRTGVKHYKCFISMVLVSVVAHIVILCTHKTMGGWHFGNRYIADCLPYIFLLYISLADYDSDMYNRFCLPFFIFGLTLNIAGTIIAFR